MSQFKQGDILVTKEPSHLELFEVERIGRNGELYDTRWRMLNTEHFKHATDEEIAAGMRLPHATH